MITVESCYPFFSRMSDTSKQYSRFFSTARLSELVTNQSDHD